MTRSYFGGSSYLIPPSVMYSATISPRPRSLMPLISASGNVFSRPTRTPTRFICVQYPFAKKEGKYLRRWCLSNRHPAPRLTASMQRSLKSKRLFTGPVLQFGTKVGFPQLAPSSLRRSVSKENGYILLRLFVALLALVVFVVSLALPVKTHAAAGVQDNKQNTKQETKQEAKQEPKVEPKQNGKDVKYTAEQIVESVILIYGTRPILEQVRRNGVEHGRLTRTNTEGATEESEYERHFIRGENLDKDKIRLDQKLPTMEYSLIFGDGKLWGLINGAAFTPRQDAAANFLSQHHHSIDSLLRYKECGSTITLAGRDQQKGLDLFLIDLVDKDQRKTRYYISARSLRVLWLEYEEGNPGGVPVKYTRKFLDYRVVQQTLVPYRTVLVEDGRQSQESRVLTITYGVKVNDSLFQRPEG